MTQIPGKTQRKSQFDPKIFFSVVGDEPFVNIGFLFVDPGQGV